MKELKLRTKQKMAEPGCRARSAWPQYRPVVFWGRHVGLLGTGILQQEPPWVEDGRIPRSPSWPLGNRNKRPQRAWAGWEHGCQSVRICSYKMLGTPPGQEKEH